MTETGRRGPQLRAKQQEVVDLYRETMIYADPMGSGKTPTSLRWLAAHDSKHSLVVAPTNVLRHWQRMSAVWTPEFHVEVTTTGTPPKKRAAQRAAYSNVLVIPYSVLRTDITELMGMRWDAVIFDEAHRLKGRKSQVHSAAERLSYRVARRNYVTGSPILNRAEEAWSLMHLNDPRRWPSYWRWVYEHFMVRETTFNGRVARPVRLIGDPFDGAIDAIRAEFGELLVMRDEDELGFELPGWIETEHEVHLSAQERRLYDDLVKRSFHRTDSGETIFTPNEVAKMTRLRQLSSDWSGLLAEAGSGTKVKAAAELIEDIGKPTVVFVGYKATAYQLRHDLEIGDHNVAVFTGDEDDDERELAREQFLSGECDVLVGTYETLAEGVDGLQDRAHHIVMLDLPWTPEMKRQAVARLRRDGQSSERVYVHTIAAADTIDQTVARALETKRDVIDAVTGRTLKQVLAGAV